MKCWSPEYEHDPVVDGEGLRARQAVNRRIQQHVLLAGQLGMEAGAELDHAGDVRAAADERGVRPSACGCRRRASGTCSCPEPFRPTSASDSPSAIRSDTPRSAQNSSLRARAADPSSAERPHLELPGIVAEHEPLRELAGLDYQRHGGIVSRASGDLPRARPDPAGPSATLMQPRELRCRGFMGADRRATRIGASAQAAQSRERDATASAPRGWRSTVRTAVELSSGETRAGAAADRSDMDDLRARDITRLVSARPQPAAKVGILPVEKVALVESADLGESIAPDRACRHP